MRALCLAVSLIALPALASEDVGSLPEAVTNNAVAAVETETGATLYSFAGLANGKTWHDAHARAFAFNLETGEAHQLADVPGGVGRLAATAVTINGAVYFFGGYTVAEDGGEVSTPETFRFDPTTETYAPRAPMPVPTDDAVALPYQDRYIYLISGWHNSGNINLTQVYDTETDGWFQATPFPGAPVFGHAGGIVERDFVIGGGVRITNANDGTRDFVMSADYWRGEISANDPAHIRWRPMEPPPLPPRYRMAAVGDAAHGAIVFVGGSTNPYNYDGVGYDGFPSEPDAAAFAYHVVSGEWIELGSDARATMDHRGLLAAGGAYYILGGMVAGQTVSDDVRRIEFSFPSAE